MRLAAESVCFSYGHSKILHDVGFSLEPGRILCLLGPNGAGKSTLIKCLAGSLRPSSGEIKVDGRPAHDLSRKEFARLTAYIPQSSGPVFPFRVRDMAVMGRTPYKDYFSQPNKADYAIVHKALEELGLLRLEDKNFTELSGGERQMVLFAAAIVQEPEILLLDEPTSHLDFGNQIRVLRMARRLADERGMSVVMATHSPDHAFFAGDCAAIMKDGRIDSIGRPNDIITEESIRNCFGTKVRVIDAGDGQKTCFPVM